MKVTSTAMAGVVLIEPRRFGDARGFFMETYHRQRYLEEVGIDAEMVQDNHSRSKKGTLRGLHYQIEHPQGKLVRVIRGEIFDVAVDLRKKSPTFGRWVSARLSEENGSQLYVAPGMAHGFCVLSEFAEVEYKCTDFYYPEHERAIVWNDPTLAIAWPVEQPLLSEKDGRALAFGDAPYYEQGGA